MSFKIGTSVVSTGNEATAALSSDRVVITRDSILQWKLEGRVFYAQQGDAGTKLDWVETAYDVDQPQFALRIPQGTLVIPLALNLTVEDTSGATEGHVIWSTTTNDIGDSATSVSAPIVNYRRDALYSSSCTARSLYTNNAAAATGLVEVKRWYIPFASALVTDGKDLWNSYDWTYEDPSMPILVGPATLQLHIYATGDGYHGYGSYTWVELKATDMGL